MELDSRSQLHGALSPLPLGPPEAREGGAERPHDARGRQTRRPGDLHRQHLAGRRRRAAGEADRREDDADDEERDGEDEHAAAGRLQRRPALRHLRQHRRADATLAVDGGDGGPRHVGELGAGWRWRTETRR